MTEMKARLVDKDGNPLGTAANPLKISGDVGGGVPDGGTTGQVLQKKTDADQDTEWGDGSGAATSWGSIVGTLSDQTDLNTVLGAKASKTASDLTLYVYEDATGTGDGSGKANGFTTLQAAIDAIPDVAQNVTVIVSKGSTNYLGDTTTIQKASVKSLTIQGEFYAYEACDANAVAGKIVDASADFSDFEVGDRVVCTKYSGTVGSSSIDDYFYATITEVGEGYIQTSEETKVPTTGWKYLINQTVFDGNNGTGSAIYGGDPQISATGLLFYNWNDSVSEYNSLTYTDCIFDDITIGNIVVGTDRIVATACAYINIRSNGYGLNISDGSGSSIARCIFVGKSGSTNTSGIIPAAGAPGVVYYSGFFNLTYGVKSKSGAIAYLDNCYIDSTCTYGAYGYNITLSNCTNNAATPVYNLTSGGRVEEAEFAASASQNLIINGDFSVAQRGTSFTSTTWRKNDDDSYLLDRWLLLSDGNDIVDVTQISGAFSRSRYALQAEVETANKKFGFCQIVEANSCILFRGQKISVSFAAKTVSAKLVENVRVAVLEWTGTADTVTSDVVSAWNAEGSNPTWATSWAALNTPANLALTTTEQTFKVENITVGSSCNNLAVFVWVDDTDAAVDDILQLGEVQVVRGSVVPEFVEIDHSVCILQCMKRFQKTYNYSVVPGTAQESGSFTGYAITAADLYSGMYVYPVPLAGTPTTTMFAAVSGTINATSMFDGASWLDKGAYSYPGETMTVFTAMSPTWTAGKLVKIHATFEAEL